jgi:hypothetical protein
VEQFLNIFLHGGTFIFRSGELLGFFAVKVRMLEDFGCLRVGKADLRKI